MSSPRTRGWSHAASARRVHRQVVPAHAGLVPTGSATRPESIRRPAYAGLVPEPSRTGNRAAGRPRARWAGPVKIDVADSGAKSSPRTRGWSVVAAVRGGAAHVVPAHAGLVPGSRRPAGRYRCLPRARGAGPRSPVRMSVSDGSSPRTRGWSHAAVRRRHVTAVVPAHAGLVPRRRRPRRSGCRRPRPRGAGPCTLRWPSVSTMSSRAREAGPDQADLGTADAASSPRTRGWSRQVPHARRRRGVVSAHAGLVRSSPWCRGAGRSRLRAGGTGPRGSRSAGGGGVVPVQAGLVLTRPPSRSKSTCRPRAGGAGPNVKLVLCDMVMSSPRRRGCSVDEGGVHRGLFVVPAQAGLVPASRSGPGRWCRLLPRAGGPSPSWVGAVLKCSRSSRAGGTGPA